MHQFKIACCNPFLTNYRISLSNICCFFFLSPLQQQMATANASSGAQFPKPSYNSGYGSAGYDTLSQTGQDYNKSSYASSGAQQSKGQNVTNPPQSGAGSDISSSMYGKGHVALNKVNVSISILLIDIFNHVMCFYDNCCLTNIVWSSIIK